ncbi:uncharacterized protein ACIBXB_006253 [Morphnus guianensis]
MTCTLSNHGRSPSTNSGKVFNYGQNLILSCTSGVIPLYQDFIRKMPVLAGFLLGVFGLYWNLPQGEGWVVSQPKQNVWVTLADMIHQDTTCFATASPENPFSTCLVGVPVDTWPNPLRIPNLCGSPQNCTKNWDAVYAHLSQATQEPQELELLGSVVMDACVFFNYSYSNTARRGQNVNPNSILYRNATAWCNYTAPNASRSSAVPLALPPGVFLICGDRAWAGIPSKLNGGPCSLGRLTLLTPNVSMNIL